jgi:hypothetical protein
MYIPEGETFRTADGSLTFAEFGELVSKSWEKAVANVPMYPTGTPSDQMTLPNITWACANRRRMNSVKNRVTDEFVGDDDKVYTKRIGEYRCVLEVRVSAEDPLEANQLIETFEKFIEQYTGAFKKAGVRELLYLERLPDSHERLGAQTVSHRTVQYEMHEQISSVEGGPLIEDIEIIANALRSTPPVSESNGGA